jgi:hypothetical protein
MGRKLLMNFRSVTSLLCLLMFAIATAAGQASSPSQPAGSALVPYASVSQMNQLLSALEQVSQQTQVDLAGLRVDRWKTDSNTKRQTQTDIDSIQRNLQTALPEMIAQLRAAPEDLAPTFKVYRNLDALYDVFGSIAENTGAFGTKDDYEIVGGDLTAFEKSRRAFADRMETLAGTKDGEIIQLRAQVRTLQIVAKPAPAPKKVVVDDTEAPKKPPAKKKSAGGAKKSAPATAPDSPQKQGSAASPQAQPQPQ